jgi:hypothetical protein
MFPIASSELSSLPARVATYRPFAASKVPMKRTSSYAALLRASVLLLTGPSSLAVLGENATIRKKKVIVVSSSEEEEAEAKDEDEDSDDNLPPVYVSVTPFEQLSCWTQRFAIRAAHVRRFFCLPSYSSSTTGAVRRRTTRRRPRPVRLRRRQLILAQQGDLDEKKEQGQGR